MKKLNYLASRTALIAIVTVLSGCSSVDNLLRVQPSTGISSSLVKDPQKPDSGKISLATDITLVLYCVEFDGKTIHPVPEDEGLGSELFLTVDTSDVLRKGLGNIPVDEERKLIRFLLFVSDHNATVWMNRIKALNEARHGLVGGLKDLTTAGSGLSAFLSPPASASLGAASLLVGGASNEIDQYVYSGNTVDTLLKGIEAARAVQYKAITDELAKDDATLAKEYGIYTALSDINQYDSLVSFRKGNEYLANLANATTNGAKAETAPAAAPAAKSGVTITAPSPPKD